MRLRVKSLASLRSKLFRPCRKLLPIFKFRLRKPVSILRHARPQNSKSRVTRLFRGFYSSRRAKKTSDTRRLAQLKSFSERGSDTMHFPSPLTPAYFNLKRVREEASNGVDDDVEDSCRSFENYLAEMIVEERKLKDLADVEELLFCWKNLDCPIFIDLVSRFYGELCKDLFSAEADQTS